MAKKVEVKPQPLKGEQVAGRREPRTPDVDMSAFPPETHCLQAARTLGVPCVECPRRPSVVVPFCWLDEAGNEHWLAYATGATVGAWQEARHQAVIRVMLRGIAVGRVMVLVHGRNEPVIHEGKLLDSGYPEFAVYHELFTDQGSVARHAAQYARFWTHPEVYYQEFRVPGPDKIPDDELPPLVAKNRCFLLPPTEARESLWAKYGGKGEAMEMDEDGNVIGPKKRVPRPSRAALPKKGEKKPRTDKALLPPKEPKPKKEPKPPKAAKPKKAEKGSLMGAMEEFMKGL